MGKNRDYPIDFDNRDGLEIMNTATVGPIDVDALPFRGWWLKRIAALCEVLAERNRTIDQLHMELAAISTAAAEAAEEKP